MVVEVFIAQRDAVHPLAHKLQNTVLDKPRVAPVGEALGKTLRDAQLQIQFVVNDEQVLSRINLKLPNQRGHCFSAPVHKRLRLG